MKKKWTILVSNDDGIDAPGIFALVGELKKIGNVIVVAPDEQRSAVGHAITMNYPLRVKKFYKNGKFFGYAVEGTPADSVKIGVRTVLGKNPDLLVSGINHGSNTAINIIYSGTVSAATEGRILGIPSLAVSLTTYAEPDFRFAAKFSRLLALEIFKNGLPEDTLQMLISRLFQKEKSAAFVLPARANLDGTIRLMCGGTPTTKSITGSQERSTSSIHLRKLITFQSSRNTFR